MRREVEPEFCLLFSTRGGGILVCYFWFSIVLGEISHDARTRRHRRRRGTA